VVRPARLERATF